MLICRKKAGAWVTNAGSALLIAVFGLPFASSLRAQEEPPPPPPPPEEVEMAEPVEEPPPPPPPVEEPPPAPEPDQNTDTGSATTGTVAAPATATIKIQPGKGSAAVPSGQELVNIDFPEPTEIKDIIKAVALWTGKNVILDRNVNGKVQIISPRKVTKEEAYQAFLSALNILGLTTVETGKVIKIMPVRTAVKGNLKTFLGSSWTPMTDEIITQIVPLKYIDAKEIQSTLSRIVSSNSMIAYPPTNTLIISDSGYKVRRVLDILELLDVQGQQAQVAIVPIRFAEAKSISEKVTEIFKTTSEAKKGSAAGGGYRSYKIMTDERTNSVIIYGPPRTIADVKMLVKRFDVQLDDPTRQATIHVRPLDYADAKKLASTLSALATGSKSGAGASPVRRPPIGRPPTTGVIGAPSTPLSVAELGNDVKIAPDESSNSLIITGSHAAYQTINSLIRKLDLRRSQVFVEADILDINMDSGFKFGTSVFAGRGGPNNTNIATTWQAAPMGPLIAAQASGANANNSAQVEKVAGVFAEDLTVGILSGKEVEIAGLGKFRPGALIRMIKNDGSTRILSSPHILTSNNEEAQIVVGEKLFFRSSELSPQTGAIVNKVEKEDVDLTLGIKPNISHANYVTLAIDLESSSATIDSAAGLPKINRRKTKQIVTVKNGQTVVVSGLVQSSEFQSFQKIPLLGDIPIIGWLFRNSNMQTVKTNLMIFLTPHIIHGADDLAAVYKSKVEERDQFLASIYGSGHVDDDFYALLPTREDGLYKPDDMDKAEKARRDELLDQMYRSTGSNTPAKPAATEPAKADEGEVYVPLGAGGGGNGDDGGGGGGGGDMEPPPMEPPPMEPPPEQPMGDDG